MGSAGTGRDMKLVVDMDMEVDREDIRSLTRGLCRVRREAWKGRQKPSLDTNQRSGELEESWLLRARLSRVQCPGGGREAIPELKF